jgi:hypothetical protein
MPDNFTLFSAILSLVLNIFQVIAIFTSFIMFFFLMINKFSKALKYILASSGFGIGPRIRALFYCRQSPVKKRAFIEFSMLKSLGYGMVSSEWHSIINEFRVFYAINEANMTYTVPNCTLFIGEDFSNVTKKYFEYFSIPKVKKTFGILDDKIGWVLKIYIEEAYVTPTCLLTGLLSRFEENWGEFIKRYVSTAYIAETNENRNKSNAILTSELYFTFAWLLWGPSYELRYKNYWTGLCQISYGDESNSIPAVANMDTDVVSKLQKEFIENQRHRYGSLVSATMLIFENKNFYKSIRNIVSPDNVYFYNKVENGPLSFAAQINDLSICDNYKAKKYYCTAYVWLLFEMEDENHFTFRPEYSIAFFEHANLTDEESYRFLIETLIDKSVKHFTDIFSKPEYKGRTYRFVCAMNDEITVSFQKRYKHIMNFESEIGRNFNTRIFLEPKHSPTAAFMAFDEYFSSSNILSYVEVSLKDKDTISDLGKFYTDIYMENFPDTDERESFNNMLLYLKNTETAKKYRYHIILVKDNNGNVLGGGIFDYFVETNSGVIEFIAVKSDLQSSGTGTSIYKHILNVMEYDAHKTNKKKLSYVFCEIDSPGNNKLNNYKYLHFWNKHNYWHLDLTYIQPSLSPLQSPVHKLWLIISPQARDLSEIQGELITKVIYDYLKYAMQINEPNENADYIKMKNELSSKPVKILNIL